MSLTAAATASNPREVIGGNKPPREEVLADLYAPLLAEIEPIVDRAASLPKKIADEISLTRLGDIVKDAGKLAKRIEAKREEEVAPHLTAQKETNGFFKAHVARLKSAIEPLQALADDYQRAKAAEQRRALEEAARKAREEEERQRVLAEKAASANRASAALKHDDRAEEAAERARRTETAAAASAADLTRVRSTSGTVASARQNWTFDIEDLEKVPLDKLRPYLPRADIEKAIRSFIRVGGRELAGIRIYNDTKASFR